MILLKQCLSSSKIAAFTIWPNQLSDLAENKNWYDVGLIGSNWQELPAKMTENQPNNSALSPMSQSCLSKLSNSDQFKKDTSSMTII